MSGPGCFKTANGHELLLAWFIAPDDGSVLTCIDPERLELGDQACYETIDEHYPEWAARARELLEAAGYSVPPVHRGQHRATDEPSSGAWPAARTET